MKDLKWIEIDLGAVRHNLRWVKSMLAPGVKLMAVVKANGYGHGAVEISRTALKEGASSLGVLTTSEAAELRKAGIKAPIQLLAPILPQNAAEVVKLKLIPTVDSLAQAKALHAAGRVGIHVDLDFGLGRWGLTPKALPEFLRGLKKLKRLTLAGLSTHIAYAPGKNSVEAEEKLSAFSRIAQGLKQENPGLVSHAANSSILMDFPHWQFDQARIGNLMYAINKASSKSVPIKRVFTFKARIIALHEVSRGQSIGYASEYVAPRRMRVATVAAGYSDGLTMEPAERLIGFSTGFQYWGVLRGIKTPFIGRCGISHLLVDVTDVPKPKLGEPVTLPVRRTSANSMLPRVYLR
jgi:alanine racemase